MEQKKFDANTFFGFLLMGVIIMWMFYSQSKQTKETQEKQELEQKIADSIQQTTKEVTLPDTPVVEQNTMIPDTLVQAQLQNQLGMFAYSATLPSAQEKVSVIENEVLKIEVNNKGGQIVNLELKDYTTYDGKPMILIKDGNAQFNTQFTTTDNRTFNTSDLYFEPKLTEKDGYQSLSMKLKVSAQQYLEYVYTLKPSDYLMDFDIRSQGMQQVINTSAPMSFNWDMKTYHTEKSIRYENQYTTLNYRYEGDEFKEVMGSGKNKKTKDVQEVEWISYRQQFFNSILTTDKPWKEVKTSIENLVKDEEIDTIFTKDFSTEIALNTEAGNLNESWQYYFGPSDYNVLKTYEGKNFERSVNMGWGIFRWINKYLFIPVFNGLKSAIGSFGLIIILLTIVVRILMSPLVYKSYLSSAKMKVLRPEMEEINQKYKGKENAMKRQQEVMALQNKAGVSMLSGCIPALLQMPVFFALFRFFPSNFDLRQQSFLWADDLSSYDSILKLPFKIPIYGDHVSLFPLLASIAIFFYMKMSQSQQANMQPPAQEGMPDMQQMMKVMLYISPVMMLFFFNMYGSGLSLYYFVSNLLTIGIMYVIKEFVIDEEKVHAMVQKKKAEAPNRKKSAFRQRLDEAMKQAQEQQEKQKKMRK
jgi:YidC/Oxa1 family membrane protein insertase